MSDAENK